MLEVISNTSLLLYLYRVGGLDWLPAVFGQLWIADVVADELQVDKSRGYDVPMPADYSWLQLVHPQCIPSAWLPLDLGPGELATMVLALEHAGLVVSLDDALARRVAQAAGLEVWGTLRVLLEAKSQGLIESVAPLCEPALAYWYVVIRGHQGTYLEIGRRDIVKQVTSAGGPYGLPGS